MLVFKEGLGRDLGQKLEVENEECDKKVDCGMILDVNL